MFEAPEMFYKNFASITKRHISSRIDVKIKGASVPSLGLSNKAVFEDVGGEDEYFKSELYDRPPTEESLVQNTLWPEMQKLYGHGYEIFCVAAHPAENVVASACKASKAEHAEIILWRMTPKNEWKIKQRLRGHSLTVTQMEFSPCGKYFLSVSRDRTWSLFAETNESGDDFDRISGTEKKNSVHQRLIWSCGWSPDSQHFFTCSRDKKIAVWNPRNGTLACKEPMILADSVTAIAVAPRIISNALTLACGLDNGCIILLKWNSKDDKWTILQTLAQNEAHHKTVKRLKFNKDLYLASCGKDHAVKVFKLTL